MGIWTFHRFISIVTIFYDEMFEVVIHHGGHFKMRVELYMLMAKQVFCRVIKTDGLTLRCYIYVKDMCYFIGGCAVLEERLQHFYDDVGALHMVNIVKRHGEVHIFMIHSICEVELVHMLEYCPANDNVVVVNGVENAIEAEVVEEQLQAEFGEAEVEVQCDGAE